MPELCQQISELAPELVRGRTLEAAQQEHVTACAECARVLAGARTLGRELAAVEVPDPSAELVARTLARIRLAEATESPASEPAPRKRRRTVEILEAWALPGPAPQVALPRDRAWLRIGIQAAAAVLIVTCTSFATLALYPSYVAALEERDVHGCQEHLHTLEAAIAKFVREHPEAAHQEEPLQGRALQTALVRGGYAREEDFLCPSVRGARPGALCYFMKLPDPSLAERPVAWDRFGNHGGGLINVVRPGRAAEQLDGGQLCVWLSEGR